MDRQRALRVVVAGLVGVMGLLAVGCTTQPPAPSSYLLYPTQDPLTGEWKAHFEACQTVSGIISVQSPGSGSRLYATIKELSSSAVLADGYLELPDDVVAASTFDLVCFAVDVVRDPPQPQIEGPFSVVVRWNY